MKNLNETTKFKIITEIKENQKLFANCTVDKIVTHIRNKFNVPIKPYNIYRWAKVYNFTYRAKRKPALKSSDATNQRIRILGIVIRNMCKELDLQHPSILDKLLDGIDKQFGADLEVDFAAKTLKDKIYDAI